MSKLKSKHYESFEDYLDKIEAIVLPLPEGRVSYFKFDGQLHEITACKKELKFSSLQTQEIYNNFLDGKLSKRSRKNV